MRKLSSFAACSHLVSGHGAPQSVGVGLLVSGGRGRKRGLARPGDGGRGGHRGHDPGPGPAAEGVNPVNCRNIMDRHRHCPQIGSPSSGIKQPNKRAD